MADGGLDVPWYVSTLIVRIFLALLALGVLIVDTVFNVERSGPADAAGLTGAIEAGWTQRPAA